MFNLIFKGCRLILGVFKRLKTNKLIALFSTSLQGLALVRISPERASENKENKVKISKPVLGQCHKLGV